MFSYLSQHVHDRRVKKKTSTYICVHRGRTPPTPCHAVGGFRSDGDGADGVGLRLPVTASRPSTHHRKLASLVPNKYSMQGTRWSQTAGGKGGVWFNWENVPLRIMKWIQLQQGDWFHAWRHLAGVNNRFIPSFQFSSNANEQVGLFLISHLCCLNTIIGLTTTLWFITRQVVFVCRQGFILWSCKEPSAALHCFCFLKQSSECKLSLMHSILKLYVIPCLRGNQQQ